MNEYGDTSLFTIKGKEKVGKIPLTKDNLIYSDRYNKYIADADKERMFDNDKNSVGEVKLWSQSIGDHVDKDEFVGIDLKGLYRIDSFDFNQGPAKGSNNGNDAYDEYVIEYSLDGVNYRRFRKYKMSENLNTYARYIRIRNLSRGERRWLKIRDISATGYKVEEIKNFSKNDTVVPAKIDNINKPRVKIIKNDDGNKKVSGAKFSLYKVLDDRINSENKGEYKVSEITFLNKSYVKEIKKNFDLIDGEVIFESRDLYIDQLGKYIIVEETAPKGCLKLKEPILLDLKEENGKAKVDVLSQKHMATSKLTSDDLVEITIKNHRFTYPSTGGMGITFFSIIGALVMWIILSNCFAKSLYILDIFCPRWFILGLC